MNPFPSNKGKTHKKSLIYWRMMGLLEMIKNADIMKEYFVNMWKTMNTAIVCITRIAKFFSIIRSIPILRQIYRNIQIQ